MTRTKTQPRVRTRSAITLDGLAQLLTDGQTSARDRWDELKADFQAKHEENRDRRHALGNKIEEVENRVHVQGERIAALEIKLVSIIGDNSGGSGLLHEIDKKVDSLKDEVQAIKTTVQDTPAIKKWVYGAIAVIAFLSVAIPLGVAILFEFLRFYTRH